MPDEPHHDGIVAGDGPEVGEASDAGDGADPGDSADIGESTDSEDGAGAGDRRAPGRTAWRPLAVIVAAAAGLLFAVTGAIAEGTDLRAGRSVRLADLIVSTEHENALAQRDLTELRAEVTALSAAEAGSHQSAQARAAAERLSDLVGLGTANGPGVTVTLDDAPSGSIDQEHPGLPDPTPDDLVVHQQDVEAAVNALWAGGATAMEIMDQRVISTSAVRCVGNTLILHGRVYSPPYKISAIGEPADLLAALHASDGLRVYRQYVTAYGLGYAARRQASLELPGYRGPLELDYAKVLGR